MECIDSSDRGHVALAHISGLAGYLVPLGGVIAPVVMMVLAEQNSQAKRAAKQALALNVFVFLLSALLVLSALTIVMIPVAIVMGSLLGLCAVGLPIYGLVQALSGHFCRYPFVGSFAD
ncbi:MAG: DUF4870 domain-containing protein [bacterium]|nr:DUF4870 domain-containing protein [Planctomycetota bacterium]HIL51872.1 DUF4870 domain-containing protein [Planctomycetota bacterium]